jgi:hypothetical protein
LSLVSKLDFGFSQVIGTNQVMLKMTITQFSIFEDRAEPGTGKPEKTGKTKNANFWPARTRAW